MDYPKTRLGHIKSSICDSIGKSDERYIAMSWRPRVRPAATSRLLDYPTISCLEPVNRYKSQQITAKKRNGAVVERFAEPIPSSNAGIARQHSDCREGPVRVHATT